MQSPRDTRQLAAENEELRARLDEAEETLLAIRSSGVDALLVSGEEGEQIFARKGDDYAYRILIEEMSEGALTITAAGDILFANRRFAEMLKMPHERVIGSMIHPWIAPDHQYILQFLLSKGTDGKCREQLDLVAQDGTRLPVNLSVSRLPVDDVSSAFCLVATDLTEAKRREEVIVASEKKARELLATVKQSERQLLSVIEKQKQAEESLRLLTAELESKVAVRTADLEQANFGLRDSTAQIQSILDTVMDGVITIDTRGLVGMINPAAERIFGYTAAEVIGQNVKMLMPEPYQSEHDGYLQRYRATGEARIIGIGREVQGRCKDGSTFALDLSVSEMRVGDECHYTGVVRDITERKQAQLEAEQANQAKSAFLATMSHEIRTPLTGMLGMLELLSMTRLEREQVDTLDTVWGSARALLRIVNDILDWSKIQEGKLQLSPRAASIHQLLQDVVDTYSQVASAKGLMLWQHSDARLGPAHKVDSLRLSQVLNNFVSNAIKFTTNGEVEVRAERLDQLDSGERVRFSVKDTGPGIAREVQAQLFERYRQGTVDTARLFGGTGLGLAICRNLADLMDGQIDLESEPGQGATFSITLTLPVADAPECETEGVHPVLEGWPVTPLYGASADAPMVLAVDDHPVNRNLLARQLVLLGFRVESAENGRAALAKWRDGRFAVVITDCHMPQMDGYQLTRAIRGIEAAEARIRTPIIGWTANALAEEQMKCRDAGMDELLVKPNNLAQLKKTVAASLSIAESGNSQIIATADVAKTDKRAGPIDFALLSQVVPDSAEHVPLLLDFQQHIRADYTKLLQLLEQGDPVKVDATAHRMKGSCRMVGAEFLASACAAIERAAKNKDLTDARAIRGTLDEALGHLDAYLSEVGVPAVKCSGEHDDDR